ncbi:MAG: sigma-70 family RNA polymerase sigma factor [Bacteroidota bacterium]
MKQQIVSDDVLVQDARQGDKDAFKKIVIKYESQVAATVIGMLGPGPVAEEVGQDVFIRFYKSLGQFQGRSSLGTYLTRIAINLSLNAIKKQKRSQKLRFSNPFESQPQDPSDGKEQERRRDINELVQFALQQLRPEFRSVVVLRLVDGYSTEETAKMLNIPVGTVLSRLARGQKKMRELIKQVESL